MQCRRKKSPVLTIYLAFSITDSENHYIHTWLNVVSENGTLEFDEFVQLMLDQYDSRNPEEELRDAFKVTVLQAHLFWIYNLHYVCLFNCA